nr:FAD:protein FMN transferase [Rhodothalassium salexigens]
MLGFAGLCALAVVVALAALRPAPVHRDTIYVFGTLVEIEIRGAPKTDARAAATRVGRLLREVHDDWHAWRPGGALSRLNAAIAEGRTTMVDPRLAAVLRRGRQLSRASGGLFDPAIGGLVALWGFHADTPPTGAPPAPDRIAAVLAKRPRMTDLSIEGLAVTSTNPAVQLDLGGFAKGAALDLAAAELRAMGIADAVLNAGGDVHVLGRHAGRRGGRTGGRPWRVAIRDPFMWGAVAAVSLRPGEGLYTSGNYERYFDHDGERFAHIIDPRTGRPVQEIVSVSVLDTDGARADAAATALSVADAGDWARVAAAMAVEAVLIITDQGQIWATEAMRDRLDPQIAATVRVFGQPHGPAFRPGPGPDAEGAQQAAAAGPNGARPDVALPTPAIQTPRGG